MARRQRVLLLDANDDFLIEVEKLLEYHGFDTTTTWASDQATALLRSRDFDLVLIGDHPPEIDAHAWLRRIREMKCPIPCLVFRPVRASEAGSFGNVDVAANWPTSEEVLKIVQEQFSAGISRLAV